MRVWITSAVTIFQIFHVWSTPITETFEEYYCTEGASEYIAKFECTKADAHCEEIWTLKKTSLATYSNTSSDCKSPCKNVLRGIIILRDCVNVTLTILCTEEFVSEHRVHFTGKISKLSSGDITNRGNLEINADIGLSPAVIFALAILTLFGIYAGLKSLPTNT